MVKRHYERAKGNRKIDQQRILEKVAQLEVSIGSPTTARDIAKALNEDNSAFSASSTGYKTGIPGMQGRKPTFYTTKMVADDLRVLRNKGLVSRKIDNRIGSAVYGRTDKAYSRQIGPSDETKNKFKDKWPVSEWEKFDQEIIDLAGEIEGAHHASQEDYVADLDDLDERMTFRQWKKSNDLKIIQKELENASQTHMSQGKLIEAMNGLRMYPGFGPATQVKTYDRRNSAMFTRSTGTYRQIGGKRFILDDVYGTKDQARYMAGYWRARGMNARVIPVKNGSAIYVRKKGSYPQLRQPKISSRRRGM